MIFSPISIASTSTALKKKIKHDFILSNVFIILQFICPTCWKYFTARNSYNFSSHIEKCKPQFERNFNLMNERYGCKTCPRMLTTKHNMDSHSKACAEREDKKIPTSVPKIVYSQSGKRLKYSQEVRKYLKRLLKKKMKKSSSK